MELRPVVSRGALLPIFVAPATLLVVAAAAVAVLAAPEQLAEAYVDQFSGAYQDHSPAADSRRSFANDHPRAAGFLLLAVYTGGALGLFLIIFGLALALQRSRGLRSVRPITGPHRIRQPASGKRRAAGAAAIGAFGGLAGSGPDIIWIAGVAGGGLLAAWLVLLLGFWRLEVWEQRHGVVLLEGPESEQHPFRPQWYAARVERS
jgi:hypothetical protein